MNVAQKNGIAFASKYKICTLSEYKQSHQDKPVAEITTCVTAQCRGRLKDMYRKKRYPASIVYFIIAAVIIGYSMYLQSTSDNENRTYLVVIAACVPLALGIGALIKSYFSSGKFLVKINTADGSDGHIDYTYGFFGEEFICHYTLMDPYSDDAVLIVPYRCIGKILIADDAVVLADKEDVGFYIMKKDMPADLGQKLCELCTGARVIDKRTVL